MPKAAPDFILPDQDGKKHSLKDYRGRWLVVYFYPRDNSLNCTREACKFRDEYRVISQFGNAEIIGINRGSVASHKRFSKKYDLNFPILSDADHKITSAYGAWRSGPSRLLGGGTRRNTYLIDPKGKIAKTYLDVNPDHHAEEVIDDLQSMQSKAVDKA